MSDAMMRGDQPIPVIIDTDIGEDIDDLLVLAFALNSPEFDVLAVTTVDGDTQARSRIARRVCAAFGRPEIPVAAGYTRPMPKASEAVPNLFEVTQGEVAPDEAGLPPACDLGADALIAKIAAERPGEVYVLTIGAMTNVGQALVRWPETAANLRAIVTNGGRFSEPGPAEIGWNLRYDPVAAAVVAASDAQWVLLSESSMGGVGLTAEDVDKIRSVGLPSTDLIATAIEAWRRNKPECGPSSLPHLSDLVVLAYLLNEANIRTWRGWAYITASHRSRLAELRTEEDPAGRHLLGSGLAQGRAQALHDLFMERILSQPIAQRMD